MFYMIDCKPLGVLISMGTNLLVEWCPTTLVEKEDIVYVPYSSALGIFMYVMVCPRLNIS
jgi:hypothetical protein